jgi:hypothetical protein
MGQKIGSTLEAPTRQGQATVADPLPQAALPGEQAYDRFMTDSDPAAFSFSLSQLKSALGTP